MYSKSKKLKEIREKMEVGNLLTKSIKNAGMKRAVIYLWRKRPLIDRYIKECKRRCEDARNDAVEDGQLKRLVDGKGSGSDYEFYLTRRRPERWPTKDNSFNITTHVHNEAAARENLKDIPLPILKRIIEHANNGNGKIPDNGNGSGSH